MSIEFDVRQDFKEMERELNAMQRKQLPKAYAAAINKTAQKIRTQTVRRISAATGVQQKVVRKRFWFNKRDRARGAFLTAKMVLITNPIPLGKLARIKPWPKGKKRPPIGARFKRAIYPGAFVAAMRSGHVGIFTRRGDARLPIDKVKQQFSPPAQRIAIKALSEIGAKEWPIEIARAMRRLIPGIK